MKRFLFLILLFLSPVNVAAQTLSVEPSQVRVALMKSVKDFPVSIRGEYTFTDLGTGKVLLEGRSFHRSIIKISEGGMIVGDKYFAVKRLRLSTNKDITIYIKDRPFRYRGHVDILTNPDKSLLVVNEVGLEEYVKGVLYHEVDHRWPSEALKVEAVAARTYVLYQVRQNKKKDFDVTGDIYSQMYGGRSAERYRTNLAVDKTEGEILVYNKKIFPTYYSSMCAGHTENVKELWDENWAPLKGVECKFCATAPHQKWVKNFRSSDVQEKLNANGYKVGAILDIKILEKNESGRIRTLKITSRDGRVVKIPGRKFRDILGPNIVKSNKYEITMKGYYFDLIGQGWGHGVGMCQWGTLEMSRQRYSYEDILKFYYPGAEMVDYHEAGF